MKDPRAHLPAATDADKGAEVEDGLNQLRADIDATDRAILQLLNRRAELVREVGTRKQAIGIPVYRAARERDLIAALVEANTGPFPDLAVPCVFREIISATYALEHPLRVAYLGPEGTFSHLAARETFGSQVETLAVSSIPEVFAAVERGDAEHGLVPVENTTEGVVPQTLDTLIASNVSISGEMLLRISNQLLSRSGRLEDVRRVASHPQPLAQCRLWLDRHLPGAERIQTASTAAAAAMAREHEDVAAIGSSLVANLTGLRTVAASIEDRRDNTTRFLVLGGAAPPPSGNDLTSVAFTVRKSESGALFRLLEPFAAHGVNLTSIQARPLKETPWEYVFFIDLEGHRDEERVRLACQAAAERANSHRLLGSFPRATEVRGGPRPRGED